MVSHRRNGWHTVDEEAAEEEELMSRFGDGDGYEYHLRSEDLWIRSDGKPGAVARSSLWWDDEDRVNCGRFIVGRASVTGFASGVHDSSVPGCVNASFES